MAPLTDCHPCLPPTLLTEFESDPTLSSSASLIFKPEFEKFRHGALKLSDDRTCMETEVVRHDRQSGGSISGIPDQLRKNMDGFGEGNRKTFLHLAAKDADVPLAYEVVRMGLTLDYKDKDGVTPLFLALENLLSLNIVLKTVSQSGFARTVAPSMRAALDPDYIKNRMSCLVKIATLLVEQHADVNAAALGYTPLSLAAEGSQWPLVELLLLHGARGPRADTLKFATSGDRLRFTSILNKTKAASPRPAQPCPCWSGKLLAECHESSGSGLPYPGHFLCGCGKRRTYAACCGKRGVIVEERWDPQDKWIMPLQVRTLKMPEVAPELQPLLEAGMMVDNDILANASPQMMEDVMDMMKTQKSAMFMDMLKVIGREDDVDPAFMFALDNVDFFARPWEGQLSKLEGQKRMNEWNQAVDTYIKTKGDPRTRYDIELEAKIGPHGGPLFRYCEAEGCNNVEKRDVEKMKCCGSCKLIFYCSQACQVSDWKAHKQKCKTKAHRVQQLPSQYGIENVITGMQMAGGMALKQSSGPERR